MREFKHLKSFESFSMPPEGQEIFEENVLRKWITGFSTSEEEKKAAENFIKILDEVELSIKKNPENLAISQGGGKQFNEESWKTAKAILLGQAKENNYRGGLRVIKSKSDDKVYVTYGKGFSGLEKVAMGASQRVDNPLG